MKNKRRILAGLLAAVLTVPLFAGGAQITAAAEAAGKTLDVVFTHDTHSHLNLSLIHIYGAERGVFCRRHGWNGAGCGKLPCAEGGAL